MQLFYDLSCLPAFTFSSLDVKSIRVFQEQQQNTEVLPCQGVSAVLGSH